MYFEFKDRYDINDLLEIVRLLRAPDGCPWDRVQTHKTIRRDFIEEVYEACEAIDEEDPAHLREELGDVLLQVVFHCILETEQNNFTFDDVTDEVCKKMIIRHPHVFGDVNADTPEQVLRNWDEIKMKTHEQKTAAEAMYSVSKTLPSLIRAEKLHKKAGRAGVGAASRGELLDDIQSRLDALRSADDKENIERKTGELLFSVAALSMFSGVDSEQSLYNVCNDFIDKMGVYEETALQRGIDIQGSDTEVTNQLWKEISNTEI